MTRTVLVLAPLALAACGTPSSLREVPPLAEAELLATQPLWVQGAASAEARPGSVVPEDGSTEQDGVVASSGEPQDATEPTDGLSNVALDGPIETGYVQGDWGIAAVLRIAGIPFDSRNSTVSSFVPMMFYEGDRFFVRGISGGAHLWKDGETEINALTRLRFFDIPAEFQNSVQGDTADFGLQYRDGNQLSWWEAELMSDARGNVHANVRGGATYVTRNWVVEPTVQLRYGTSDFVSRYFAVEPLTNEDADGAFILTPGVAARYHFVSDLYLLGSIGYSFFDEEIRDLTAIDDPGAFESFIGFGFFQDRGTPQFLGRPRVRETVDRSIESTPHLRVAQGWGTPSNLGSILGGDIESDEFDNEMTSVFYGYPLTDRLFGLPFEVFMSPGLAYHWSSDVQDETFELVLKIHLYYTVHWPIRWRLGVAEGVSWIEDVTFLERESMLEKGYRPSELMNYLDFTLDLNVGDLFGAKKLERLWFGASIHHRSSIFESASQFGRIKGGSNYPSLYLQWDFL